MKRFPILAILLLLCSCGGRDDALTTFLPEEITVGEPLSLRMDRNFQRLESDIYQTDRAIQDDKNWPGDYVGRVILGVTMEARALGKEPAYLEAIIDSLPTVMNARGYLGADYGDVINEQQLSGHGWLLRGLCEYERWKGDGKVLPLIRTITDSLFLVNRGRFAYYPISKDERSNKDGAASGAINSLGTGWMLSSDIGCLFIGMAGLIDAYETLRDPAIVPVIEELLIRFCDVDLVGVQMQTHATLSALRGMLKYHSLTGDDKWLKTAGKCWDIYVAEGMTCNFANYNWFGRHDAWTEPCAMVDSYMVAFELWKKTLDPQYRDIAELIYFNGLCHGQRHNGGFGCDSCPSEEDPFIKVRMQEAYWCCTMRGGEGLPKIAESSFAEAGDTLYVPFLRNAGLETKKIALSESTKYPFEGGARFRFGRNKAGICVLMLPQLPWAGEAVIKINGRECDASAENGFYKVEHKFKAGDRIEYSFPLSFRVEKWQGGQRFFNGPLMLSLDTDTPVEADKLDPAALKPLWHLMEQEVWDGDYRRQVLF